MLKRVLYIRSGPYKPNIKMYNMQEIGLAKAFAQRGISTDIVYYSNETKTELFREFDDTTKIQIKWEKGYKILRTGYYPNLLNRQFLSQYDLIILTEFSQIMTYLVSRISDKCVLYTGPYYNLFKLPFVEPIYDWIFTKKINGQINKIYTKSVLAEKYMIKKGYTNVTTIGVGLDSEKFMVESELPRSVQDTVEYLKENKCLLYVGTMCDRKNFPFILKVYEYYINELNGDFKLVLIGSGKKSYIEKYFGELSTDVRDNILYIEKIENTYLKHIYSNANIFLLPSKLEIFGMVLLEAMNFGCYVISSFNGGSSTLIKNGLNGTIIEQFDVETWAKEIDVASKDEELYQKKQNAIETVTKSFYWENIADKLLKELPERFGEF